jgi:hypothetical protein
LTLPVELARRLQHAVRAQSAARSELENAGADERLKHWAAAYIAASGQCYIVACEIEDATTSDDDASTDLPE